jgi:hypothetical protein
MKYLTQYVPLVSGDGMSDGYVVVEENGELKLQKLSFNGTEATPDGVTEAIGNVGLFATGMDEPAYNGSGTGGVAKYYKCVSVNISENTWTGYELVLNNGKYTVSEALTEGLSYTSVIPSIGSYYTDGCLITCIPYFGWEAPSSGLVFYAPLKTVDETTAQTGENLTFSNSTNSVQDGIYCVAFNSGYMNCIGANAPTGNSPRTVSMWVKQMQTVGEFPIGGYGASDSSGQNEFFSFRLYNGRIGIWGDDADWDTYYDITQTVWHHYLWLNDGATDKIYIDGVFVAERSYTRDTANNYIFIGGYGHTSDVNQYVTAFRIYNRVLTQDEITVLANEFTPITA